MPTVNIEQQIHEGDYGTTFDIELHDGDATVDPAVFTTQTFIFRRPDQTTYERTAVDYISSSGSFLRYTTGSGDFNQAGQWALQARVGDGIGQWSSEVREFTVYPNLD